MTFETHGPGSLVRIGIDTGADAGVQLSPRGWNHWRSKETALATVEAIYTPGDGFVIRDVFHARAVTVGQLTVQDVPVSAATFSAETAFEQSDAILGLFALSRFEMLIDGKNGLLYTRPVAHAARRYAYNRLGAVFVPEDRETNATLIAHVVEGSPAARAGIRNGDELLKIGDLDASLWRTDPRLQPLHRFWSKLAGTKLRLVLKQGGHLYEATVSSAGALGAPNGMNQAKNGTNPPCALLRPREGFSAGKLRRWNSFPSPRSWFQFLHVSFQIGGQAPGIEAKCPQQAIEKAL